MHYRIVFCSSLLMGILNVSLWAQQPFFDGQSFNGWTTVSGKPVTKGWEVVDGMIHLNTQEGRGGNIVTEREYRDFELRFEWKTVPGGNSGKGAARRLVSAKCSACHLAPAERSMERGELTGSLERHGRRLSLTQEEVELIAGFLER